MSEDRATYATPKTFTTSAPARIVIPITLTEPDEINLLKRYRQARLQGLSFVVNTDSGELQLLGRIERLRAGAAY